MNSTAKKMQTSARRLSDDPLANQFKHRQSFVDERPDAVAQSKLQIAANNSPPAKQIRAMQLVADKQTLHSRAPLTRHGAPLHNNRVPNSHGVSGKTAYSTALPSSAQLPVVQLVRYRNPTEMGPAVSRICPDLTADEVASVCKEFPNWYNQTKGVRCATVEFTDELLRTEITAFIAATDGFTDAEGEALAQRINETSSDKLLIGFRARGEDKPGNVAPKPFGGGKEAKMPTQIGEGFYVAKNFAVAMEYAEQYVAQNMIGVIQAVYLRIDNIRKTLQLKGVSVKEWWNKYKSANNEDYDVVVAAISGKVDEIQYKVNPKLGFGLFEAEDIQRVEE